MGKGRRAIIPRNSSDLGRAAIPADISMHKAPPSAKPAPHVPHTDDSPLFTLVTTYLSYLVLIVFGHFRDFLDAVKARYQLYVLGKAEAVSSRVFSIIDSL